MKIALLALVAGLMASACFVDDIVDGLESQPPAKVDTIVDTLRTPPETVFVCHVPNDPDDCPTAIR